MKVNGTKRILQSGIFWFLIGLLLMFVGLYLKQPDQIAPQGTIAPSSLQTTFHELILTTGIAFFGFGLFSIIMQLPDWRNYFEDRIKHIVIEQSYLDGLDIESLKALQINVLKAQFKNPNIDKEGSFLNYFHINLHKYISEPYRQDVMAEIFCETSGTQFRIFDKVTYTCRKSADKIQELISWKPDKDEFQELENLEIKIQYPYTHQKKGEVIDLFTREQFLKECKDKPLEELGVKIPLNAYTDIDGLIVTIQSKYLVSVDKFQYWQMAHPTKNFSITIKYPKEYKLQIKPLVINEELCLRTDQPGYYNLKYDSWMLPMSGVAWCLREKKGVSP